MTKSLKNIINAVSAVLAGNKKAIPANKPYTPLKIYTFFIHGEGVRKSVNIKAPDKQSAEEKVHAKYPDCKADFLWELVRSS